MQPSHPTPKRIALTIHALFGGGAERLMAQLALRWSEAGHDVHLVTWSGTETDQYRVPIQVKRHGLALLSESSSRLRGIAANVRRIRVLRNTLRTIEPDLIVSFCDQMNIVTLQAARKLAAPVVIAEHSNPAKQKLNRLWEYWRSRVYPHAAECVVLTDEIAKYMRRWVAESKIRVIPAAIAPPANQDLLPREKNVILGVGRLSREKGFDVLIEAWRRIHQRLPGWTLRIAGEGPEREKLTTQAMDMPSVQLLGWTANVWPLYQHATVFVLPSRYEGFPVALVEALSQGCPSIATRCTEATQIPPLSDALQLVDPESPEQLAEAILRLVSQGESLEKMSRAGVLASSQFHWEAVGLKWDQLLSI